MPIKTRASIYKILKPLVINFTTPAVVQWNSVFEIQHQQQHQRYIITSSDTTNTDMTTGLYLHYTYIQGGPNKIATISLYALTFLNIKRFSKLFHCQNQDKICNRPNTVTKDPTTPQMCR